MLSEARGVLDASSAKLKRWSLEAKGRQRKEAAEAAAMEAQAKKIKDPKRRALALLRAAVVARSLSFLFVVEWALVFCSPLVHLFSFLFRCVRISIRGLVRRSVRRSVGW